MSMSVCLSIYLSVYLQREKCVYSLRDSRSLVSSVCKTNFIIWQLVFNSGHAGSLLKTLWPAHS